LRRYTLATGNRRPANTHNGAAHGSGGRGNIRRPARKHRARKILGRAHGAVLPGDDEAANVAVCRKIDRAADDARISQINVAWMAG